MTDTRVPVCPHCGKPAEARGLEPGPHGTMARFECDPCRWAVLLSEAALMHNHPGVPMPQVPGQGW